VSGLGLIAWVQPLFRIHRTASRGDFYAKCFASQLPIPTTVYVQEIINPFTVDGKADNAFGLGRFQSRNIFANSFF
jgi:hypothetical protein